MGDRFRLRDLRLPNLIVKLDGSFLEGNLIKWHFAGLNKIVISSNIHTHLIGLSPDSYD